MANNQEQATGRDTDAAKHTAITSLKEIMGLIESEEIVRNTDRDGESGFHLRALKMVKILADAQAVIDANEIQENGTLVEKAKLLYDESTISDAIHCNRFPAWFELSKESQQEWLDKAKAAIQLATE